MEYNDEHYHSDAGTIILKTTTNAVVENDGNAPYSRAHISCEEITKGEKVIVATTPILKITNDLAELTHEALTGRVSEKQLETLMAKGLTE